MVKSRPRKNESEPPDYPKTTFPYKKSQYILKINISYKKYLFQTEAGEQRGSSFSSRIHAIHRLDVKVGVTTTNKPVHPFEKCAPVLTKRDE